MANKPKKKTYDFRPYPKKDGLRVGCKVSWYYYKNKDDAIRAAAVAVHNAEISASLGYDFGYCTPGSITRANKNWGEYEGMWEVCIP